MRKALWVIAVALSATLSPVLKADTTYTVNQTFNVDGGAIINCNPSASDCSARTAYITGTITTDGSTGLLSSSDITALSLVYGAGSLSRALEGGAGSDAYQAGVGISGLYALDNDLFFVGAQGGSFLTGIGNGWSIIESVTASPGSQNLDFSLDWAGFAANGSTPLSNGIVTIATVTPEPGTAVLWFLGLALIVVLRRRGFAGPRSVQASEV